MVMKMFFFWNQKCSLFEKKCSLFEKKCSFFRKKSWFVLDKVTFLTLFRYWTWIRMKKRTLFLRVYSKIYVSNFDLVMACFLRSFKTPKIARILYVKYCITRSAANYSPKNLVLLSRNKCFGCNLRKKSNFLLLFGVFFKILYIEKKVIKILFQKVGLKLQPQWYLS
jgi:hypothetical protein